jgi:ubiquinone/menaquinone biosynthesis C-methylase UbiE
MEDSRTAWDNDYRSRGQLWGGAPPSLPLSLLDMPAGSKVLEIGCGSGKTVSALMDRSCDIIAFDFSEKAVELSRRVIGRYYAGDAIVADARNFPFFDHTIGFIIASHVIGHIQKEERTTIAKEVERVLQAGGRLLLQEFSVDDMRNGTGKRVEDSTFLRGTGIITHYFTENEVGALFSSLINESIRTRYWTMRVRGRDLRRAEIVAVFIKKN